MHNLLITSCITPSAEFTKLQDKELRISGLLDTIRWAIRINYFKTIIVCDGSSFELNESLIKEFQGNNHNFFFCSFHNDYHNVARYGKGLGEVEIIDYAVSKYRNFLMPGFVKLTSKYIVTNHKVFLTCLYGRFKASAWGRLKPYSIDSRVFYVATDFWELTSPHIKNLIDDNAGIYLEHVLNNYLIVSKINYLTVLAPNISGLSGSTGIKFIELSNTKLLYRHFRQFVLYVFCAILRLIDTKVSISLFLYFHFLVFHNIF